MQRNVCIGLAALLPVLSACGPDLPATRQTTDAQGNAIVEVKLPDEGRFVSCDDPDLGARRFVTTNEGRLLYAGQALMNQTCARGQCHHVAAEGDNRLGAPAGLDFDLPLGPLPPEPLPRDAMDRVTEDPCAAPVDPAWDPYCAHVLHLQVNQRGVYDQRGDIWKQVDKGHMPPGGVGQAYREAPGLTFVSYDAANGCQEQEQMAPITESETREILAVWLACGSPLIELSDQSISGDLEGLVGREVPACEVMGPGEDVTFDRVYAELIEPTCVPLCHEPGGTWAQLDYSTPQTAYNNMVDAPLITTATCPAGAPQSYVVPNDPEESALLHKMGDPELVNLRQCGALMPFGATEPLVVGTELVRAWIEQGAPPPGAAGTADSGSATAVDGGM